MAMTLITTNTSSNGASSDFTSSIDSTYKLYIFKFYDVNPATNNVDLTFNGSIDGGSNYNVTKTTTFYRAKHFEDDSDTAFNYEGGLDLAQGTGFQTLMNSVASAADGSTAGILHLFSPSSTTYVKHFYAEFTANNYQADPGDYNNHTFIAGYFNDAGNDIDAVQFKMSSGNMDAVIKMYGVG